MTDLELELFGWRLTTAEILYRIPDCPSLLQIFVWQELDLQPRFPRLNKFLTFWNTNLDGPVHTVRVAVRGIIGPTDLKQFGKEFRLN